MNQELPNEEPEPEYYNREELAQKAGICMRKFTTHETLDIAGIRTKGREVYPGGIGIVYPSGKAAVKKYLALCAAAGRREKQQKKRAGKVGSSQ